MLKIAIMCHYGLGGSGILATQLGLELANKGHEVHFIALGRPHALQEHKNVKLHVVEIPEFEVLSRPPDLLVLIGRLEAIAKKHKFDIIHSHYLIPFAVAATVVKQNLPFDVKTVATMHGTDVTLLGSFEGMKGPTLWALKQTDRITSVSCDLKKTSYKHFGKNFKCDVIYNFLANPKPPISKETRSKIRMELNIKPKQKLLVHASNFRSVKCIDDVVEAFFHIQKEVDAKLLMLGDGPQLAPAKDLSSLLGIRDKVLFLGKKKNVLDWIGSSDLKLLLSAQESFGLVLLESFSQGIPAVATKVGGIPEVLEDKKHGFLTPFASPKKAAQKSLEILTNDELYKKMVKNCLVRINDFATKKIVQEYEKLYKSLLKTKKS